MSMRHDPLYGVEEIPELAKEDWPLWWTGIGRELLIVAAVLAAAVALVGVLP